MLAQNPVSELKSSPSGNAQSQKADFLYRQTNQVLSRFKKFNADRSFGRCQVNLTTRPLSLVKPESVKTKFPTILLWVIIVYLVSL
jgi:hypothetical protein